MAEPEQITRHEREIGELRGKLDGLATKDFVRQVVQEQTQEIYRKLDAMSAENNERFTAMSAENNERFTAMSAENNERFAAMSAENNKRFEALIAENNKRFTAMSAESDKRFDAVTAELKALNDKQHRIIGAADFLRAALPMFISVVTLIVLIISLLAANG